MSPLRVTVTSSGSGLLPALDAPLPALGLAQHPPVVLGAQRAGADEHRVDLLAQAVEDRAVAVVAEPAGAAVERSRGRRRS